MLHACTHIRFLTAWLFPASPQSRMPGSRRNLPDRGTSVRDSPIVEDDRSSMLLITLTRNW
jgi:hypothetical protein